jgi:Icc-related predicted phosphoesterase
MKKPLRIVLISDTHQLHEDLDMPEGDILIHAGDFSAYSTEKELEKINAWFGTLPYKKVFLTPGNHDGELFNRYDQSIKTLTNATVLLDEAFEYEGYKIYGTPWCIQYGDWWFMSHEKALQAAWNDIPIDTDILITHQPPYDILDHVARGHAGSVSLRETVLERVKPKLHVFGHLHMDGGQTLRKDGTIFVNAAMCDEDYEIHRKPVVILLGQEEGLKKLTELTEELGGYDKEIKTSK